MFELGVLILTNRKPILITTGGVNVGFQLLALVNYFDSCSYPPRDMKCFLIGKFNSFCELCNTRVL